MLLLAWEKTLLDGAKRDKEDRLCYITTPTLWLRKKAPGEDLGIEALSRGIIIEIIVFFLRESYLSVVNGQRRIKRDQMGVVAMIMVSGRRTVGRSGSGNRENREISEGNHAVVTNWRQMTEETGGWNSSSWDCKLLGRKVSEPMAQEVVSTAGLLWFRCSQIVRWPCYNNSLEFKTDGSWGQRPIYSACSQGRCPSWIEQQVVKSCTGEEASSRVLAHSSKLPGWGRGGTEWSENSIHG